MNPFSGSILEAELKQTEASWKLSRTTLTYWVEEQSRGMDLWPGCKTNYGND